MKTTQIRLASRPKGEPVAADFEKVEVDLPEVGEGQVALRTIYLSLDPYMRGRMSDARSYAQPVEIGGVIAGGTVCQVVQSRSDKFKEGDFVLSMSGWQSADVVDAKGLRKLDPADAPISTAVGVLGMPGLTAYVGLLDIGQPKEGRPSWSLRLPVRSARSSASSPGSRAREWSALPGRRRRWLS